MKISQLIDVAQSKLATLNTEMTTAVRTGNTDEIVRLDAEIAESQRSIENLNTLE